MKNFTKLTWVLGLFILVSSCMITGVAGSRHVTTETRTIPDSFTGIKVSQGIEVQLTQGKDHSLSIEMDDNLHELLITEVEDGILKIYFKKNVNKRKSSTLYLTTPIIEMIETSSGASVVGTNTFKTSDLSLDSSSGSEINIRVKATTITAESSSGSAIKLEGTSTHFSADSSSGSEIDAIRLTSKQVSADVSSGASIEIDVTDNLMAKASSGGSIHYKGEPVEKSIRKSSGGSVSSR